MPRSKQGGKGSKKRWEEKRENKKDMFGVEPEEEQGIANGFFVGIIGMILICLLLSVFNLMGWLP